MALVTPEPLEQPSRETPEKNHPQSSAADNSGQKTPPQEREEKDLYLLPEEATTQGGDEAMVNIPIVTRDCSAEDDFNLELNTPERVKNENPLGGDNVQVEKAVPADTEPLESQASQILSTVVQ